MARATFRHGSAHRARIIAAGGIAGAVVLGTPMAWAAISPDQDQLHACVTRGGTIRVIDVEAGEQCGRNEVPVTLATGATSLPDGSVRGGEGGVVEDGTIDSHDLEDGGITADDLGFDALTSSFKTELAASDGAANEDDDLVSWYQIKDLTADGEGTITGEFLADGSVGAADIAAGAINDDHIGGLQLGSADIADGTIVEADLRSELGDLLLALPDRLTDLELLEPQLSALEERVSDLGDPGAADKVDTRNLFGVVTTTVEDGSALSVPPGSTASLVLTVPGIAEDDFLAVSPPPTLPSEFVFGGAYTSGPGQVTVRLTQMTSTAASLPPGTWTVNWIDLT